MLKQLVIGSVGGNMHCMKFAKLYIILMTTLALLPIYVREGVQVKHIPNKSKNIWTSDKERALFHVNLEASVSSDRNRIEA